MLDMGSLITTAIISAATFLGEKAAGAAASSFGTSVFSWLKSKLSDPSGRAVLEKFEQNPQSVEARNDLTQTLMARLTQDPKLATHLAALLNAGGSEMNATQTVTQGDGFQFLGHNVTVNQK